MTDAAIRFLLDENMRGVLIDAILQHNWARPHEAIDVVRVGDDQGPPLATPDPEVLDWAEREGRILISWDKRSLPGHLRDHLAAGKRSPGILIAPRGAPIKPLVAQLVLIAYASAAGEYADQLNYLQL